MEMTQIQRDALARARRGDFELADAIELEARIKHNAFGGDIVGGYRAHRLMALGEGVQEYDNCSGCDGKGEIQCEACDKDGLVECSLCQGQGEVPGPLGAATECPNCAGTTETECAECAGDHFVECDDCAGDGDVPGITHITRVVDLNGRVLWDQEGGGDEENPEPGNLVGIDWAEAVIRKYNEAAAEGAATTTEEAA